MLKNVNVILLCLMMSGLMVACGGGESSSSGVAEDMAKRSYEFSFVSLPECRVDYTKKIIYAAQSTSRTDSLRAEVNGCKTTISGLNNNMMFSLKCDFLDNRKVSIRGLKDHVESLKNMVETGTPYIVTCIKSS